MRAPDEVMQEMEHSLAIDAGRDRARQCQDGIGIDELAGRDLSTGFRRRSGDAASTAAGDGLRFALRRLPRRRHLRAGDERDGAERPEDPFRARRHDARRTGNRPVRPAATPVSTSSGRARSAT